MIRLLRRRPMTCDEVMEVLQSHLDGEVDARTARRVARHLHLCAGCARESGAFRSIKASLVHVRPDSVDPEVMARLQTFTSRVIDGEIG